MFKGETNDICVLITNNLFQRNFSVYVNCATKTSIKCTVIRYINFKERQLNNKYKFKILGIVFFFIFFFFEIFNRNRIPQTLGGTG